MIKFSMPVAVHLFLIQGDQILLLRRFNTGFMDGKYSVIAGHVEACETVIQAMQREAKEEAGITIDEVDLRVVQVMHRNSDSERIDYFFVAEKWVGDLYNVEPNKCDDLSWFRIDAMPENMIPYVKYAFESYQRNQQFTLFGW